MAKAEPIGEVPDVSANNAVVSDIGTIEGAPTPTPSSGRRADGGSSEELAKNPAITEAYDRIFGGGKGKAKASKSATATAEAPKRATRRNAIIHQEEEVEELDGLEADETDDGIEPEGEAKPSKDEADAASHAAEEEPEKTPKQQEGDDPGSPTLSPVLRHAAKRAGWEDSDIDDLAKANPEMAEKTFTRLLRSFNDLSAEYGRLGAASAAVPQQIAAPQAPSRPAGQEPAAGGDLFSNLYGPDKVAAIRGKYGDDFVDEVLSPLLAPVQEMYARAQRQEMESTAREIGDFFGSLPGEFSELYGTGNQVSEAQMEARLSLARLADQQRRGAASVGIHLSVKEGLDNANLQFASQHLSALERKKITAQVAKRSSQITQRPSQRSRPSASGGRSIEAAQEAYEKKAAELGLDIGDVD